MRDFPELNYTFKPHGSDCHPGHNRQIRPLSDAIQIIRIARRTKQFVIVLPRVISRCPAQMLIWGCQTAKWAGAVCRAVVPFAP